MTVEALRTPDERFAAVTGFDHPVRHVDVEGGLRVAVVDAGPADAAPVLLLHGEPSWSYLWRSVVDVLLAAGHRCVAPDLVGFGRSDKPVHREDHTYARHVGWMHDVLEALDLRETTLVCHDWGGLIGLRLVAEHDARFARVVATNTGLPTGDQDLGEAFHAWRTFSQMAPDFHCGGIVRGGCAGDLDDAVVAAYDAPFPDDAYLAGPRQMPALVPASPDDPAAGANRRAWEALSRWERPFLCAFSDRDPITRGSDRVFRSIVPGTRDLQHTVIEGAGHFLQEDAGARLGEVVAAFLRATGG